MKKYYFLFAICYMLFLPVLAFAHPISLWPTGYWGPFVTCSAASCTLCDLVDTFQHFIYFGISLVVFAIGPVMLVWGGIMMLVAGGSPERFSSGRKIATGAAIGIVIALGAFVIINTFLWMVGNGKNAAKVSWPNIECRTP